MRANIAPRGGDPEKLFLLGHSSGALLVALVGTDERYPTRHGLKTSDLRGVIPMGSIMFALVRDFVRRLSKALRISP